MSRRRTLREEVAEAMAVGLDPGPEGIDTPFDDAGSYAAEAEATKDLPSAIEKPEDRDGRAAAAMREIASDRGAVGSLVAELLADPGLSYEAIVDRVMATHPTVRTTVRSVASTACVMRKKGADVPVRRKSKQ